MERKKIVVVFLLLGISQFSIAQNIGNAFSNSQSEARYSLTTQQLIESQNKLNQYKKQRRGGFVDIETLESVHVTGLDKTPDNVKTIRSLLSSNVTSDEKVVLARILGSLHTHDDKTGLNSEIIQGLKGAAYSDDKVVARAGALAYSRLGYLNDSNDVLQYAKNNGYIDTDEYYGEIAHLVPYAPAIDQIDLVTKIKNGNNKYATEILAFIVQNPEVLKRIYPETQKAILDNLEANEPGFALALGEFGYIDAVRYATWLQSVATLKSTANNVKYEGTILAHLNDTETDPRKIMAFLVSSEGKTLIKSIGKGGAFDSALERISIYSRQLPQNVLMKDIVQDITATINSVKGWP